MADPTMAYDIDFNSLDGGDWAEMFDSHDGFNGSCEWMDSRENGEDDYELMTDVT